MGSLTSSFVKGEASEMGKGSTGLNNRQSTKRVNYSQYGKGGGTIQENMGLHRALTSLVDSESHASTNSRRKKDLRLKLCNMYEHDVTANSSHRGRPSGTQTQGGSVDFCMSFERDEEGRKAGRGASGDRSGFHFEELRVVLDDEEEDAVYVRSQLGVDLLLLLQGSPYLILRHGFQFSS